MDLVTPLEWLLLILGGALLFASLVGLVLRITAPPEIDQLRERRTRR